MIENLARPEGVSLRLLLLRHAEPESSARGRCYGKLDVALSDRGRRQALAAAAHLRGAGVRAIYASPRRRARETAESLSRVCGVETIVDVRLSEIDFGRFEGMTYDEAQESDPDLYRRWMTQPTEVRFPGGESFADMERRVKEAVSEIRGRHRDETVALVAHGGVNRVVLAEALDLPRESLFRLGQGYGSLSVVDEYEDSRTVVLLNGVFPC